MFLPFSPWSNWYSHVSFPSDSFSFQADSPASSLIEDIRCNLKEIKIPWWRYWGSTLSWVPWARNQKTCIGDSRSTFGGIRTRSDLGEQRTQINWFRIKICSILCSFASIIYSSNHYGSAVVEIVIYIKICCLLSIENSPLWVLNLCPSIFPHG